MSRIFIMEWNNPRSSHQEWENEWRYYPQKAVSNDGVSIPLIWADSIAFQLTIIKIYIQNTRKLRLLTTPPFFCQKCRFFTTLAEGLEMGEINPHKTTHFFAPVALIDVV